MLYQYVMIILWSGWSMFDVRCSAYESYLSGNCDRNTDHDINCCDYWVVHDNLTAERRRVAHNSVPMLTMRPH